MALADKMTTPFASCHRAHNGGNHETFDSHDIAKVIRNAVTNLTIVGEGSGYTMYQDIYKG